MKKTEKQALSMWGVVRQHLDANNSIWASNAPFANASHALTKAIDMAKAALLTQGDSTKGITGGRRQRQMDAISKVVAISRCAAAYALDTNNTELLVSTRESKGVLAQYGQHVLAAALRRIMNAALEHREALVDYGVAAEAIDAALEAIGTMEYAQNSVRRTITGKKAVTEHVPAIIESGRLALAKMDRMIHIFEAQYPEFVASYRTARGIVQAGSRHKDDGSAKAA